MCFGCGGVGGVEGEWVGGLGQGLGGWGDVKSVFVLIYACVSLNIQQILQNLRLKIDYKQQ